MAIRRINSRPLNPKRIAIVMPTAGTITNRFNTPTAKGFRFSLTEENVTEAPRMTKASGVAISDI